MRTSRFRGGDMDIVEKLVDLHKQATEEKSHYYVAAICQESIIAILSLRLELSKLQLQLKPQNRPQAV